MASTNRAGPPKAMGQLTADRPPDDSPTSEGGQPPPRREGAHQLIPVGLERVLYLAAVEPEFKQQLLELRDRAARDRGMALRDTEQMMLRTVSEPQLLASIDGIDTSDNNLERRRFLRAVAASAVTIAAGEALLACSDDEADIKPDSRILGLDSSVRSRDAKMGHDISMPDRARPRMGHDAYMPDKVVPRPDSRTLGHDTSRPTKDGP